MMTVTRNGDGDDEECRWRKIDFEKQTNLSVFLHFRSRKYYHLKLILLLILFNIVKINKSIKIKIKLKNNQIK